MNLVSAALMSQALLSFFETTNIPLKIILMSSPAASIGIPGAAIYWAAKAGMEALVRVIHSEISFYKNAVKCISFMPGRIDTDMQAEMRSYSKEAFPVVDRYKGFHEKGELQNPKSVAKMFCENLMEKDFEAGRAARFHQAEPPSFMLAEPLRSVSDELTFSPSFFPVFC